MPHDFAVRGYVLSAKLLNSDPSRTRAEQDMCRAGHVLSRTRAEQDMCRAGHVLSRTRAEQDMCRAGHVLSRTCAEQDMLLSRTCC